MLTSGIHCCSNEVLFCDIFWEILPIPIFVGLHYIEQYLQLATIRIIFKREQSSLL